MTLSSPNLNAQLVSRLAEKGAFDGDPLKVVDVGCALGIEGHWRQFPLRARAIDPMVKEIERLKGLEADPNVEYLAGFVKQPDYPAIGERNAGLSNCFGRSSAMYVASRTPAPYNGWEVMELSERTLTLDGLCAELGAVDFIKTDTDGSDLEVLHSGSATLPRVLGVSVEALIAGTRHPLSNDRSNIDQLLRSYGLSLFDEETHRYSRAAMPDRFVYGVPAQTQRGQVMWAQCLYLRDLVEDGGEWPDSAYRKLACLFEVYHLNDCAAELIEFRPQAFAPYVEPQEALDILTREWWPEQASYAELKASFEADYTRFYP